MDNDNRAYCLRMQRTTWRVVGNVEVTGSPSALRSRSRNRLRGDRSASSALHSHISPKKTSGELRVLPTEKHRCDSVSAFAYIQVGRDSGETRLLRFLAGYRHFFAHAKAINEMVRRWIRPDRKSTRLNS